MKCLGYYKTSDRRCPNTVKQSRRDQGLHTCGRHANLEELAKAYAGDPDDDEAVAQYYRETLDFESGDTGDSLDSSSPARLATLALLDQNAAGVKFSDIAIEQLLNLAAERKAQVGAILSGIGITVTLTSSLVHYKLMGFGWQDISTDLDSIGGQIVGAILIVLMLIAALSVHVRKIGVDIDKIKNIIQYKFGYVEECRNKLERMSVSKPEMIGKYEQYIKRTGDENSANEELRAEIRRYEKYLIRWDRLDQKFRMTLLNPFVSNITKKRIRKLLPYIEKRIKANKIGARKVGKIIEVNSLIREIRNTENFIEKKVVEFHGKVKQFDLYVKRGLLSKIMKVTPLYAILFILTIISVRSGIYYSATRSIDYCNSYYVFKGFFELVGPNCQRVTFKENYGGRAKYHTIGPVLPVGEVGALSHYVFGWNGGDYPREEWELMKSPGKPVSIRTDAIVLTEQWDDEGTHPSRWSPKYKRNLSIMQTINLGDVSAAASLRSPEFTNAPTINVEPSVEMKPKVVVKSIPGGPGAPAGNEVIVIQRNDISSSEENNYYDESTTINDHTVNQENNHFKVRNHVVSKIIEQGPMRMSSNFFHNDMEIAISRDHERHMLAPFFTRPIQVSDRKVTEKAGYPDSLVDFVRGSGNGSNAIDTLLDGFLMGYHSMVKVDWEVEPSSDKAVSPQDPLQDDQLPNSYLGVLGYILAGCGAEEPIRVDIVGYASNKPRDDASEPAERDVDWRLINLAIAEGRRARVIRELVNPYDPDWAKQEWRLLGRNDGQGFSDPELRLGEDYEALVNFAERVAIEKLDQAAGDKHAKFLVDVLRDGVIPGTGNPFRFLNPEEMYQHLRSWIDDDGVDGPPLWEAFERSVMISTPLESLTSCGLPSGER